MEFDFKPELWLRILHDNPVLIVLIAGALGGSALTQAIKLSYLAWFKQPVTDARFHNSVMWLAIVATFALTNALWEGLIGETHSGLRHVVSAVAGMSAPLSYKTVKALVAWKWPGFAERWFTGAQP